VSVAGAPLAGTSGKRARTELGARERIGMAGPLAASPRPEWLWVSGPRPGHSAGFLLCTHGSRNESPTDRAEKAGSRRHDLHAPGTRPLSGRLFRHGNVIGISAICPGMPPPGARSQDRAASQNHAGNGAGLGEARQGDRRGRRSRLALTAFFLRVWQVPLACQTKPNLRHVQQGGPGFRVMERSRHLQALGGVASTLVGSPHRVPSADLAQRGSPPDVPVASGAFTRFSRALSRRAGRRPVVWGPKCDRDTGGGAPPRRPDVEPRQSGL
jgi:hypothetical protein